MDVGGTDSFSVSSHDKNRKTMGPRNKGNDVLISVPLLKGSTIIITVISGFL